MEQIEDMETDGYIKEEEMSQGSEESDVGENEEQPKVYLPHKPLKHNEELVCDQSAYIILREVQTGMCQGNIEYRCKSLEN